LTFPSLRAVPEAAARLVAAAGEGTGVLLQAGAPAPALAEAAASVPDAAVTLLLAVVQGLTEFLPISSSGHLVLVEQALTGEGSESGAGLLLPIALHLGTLVAVLIVYRRDVLQILRDLVAGRPREALLVVLGTLPAGIVGVAFKDYFGGLFASGRSAALGLLVTAALLVVADRARRRAQAAGGGRRELGWTDALVIGCVQAVAIFPGLSRSGSTIAVGMLRGLEPLQAARFSFLLSIPAILGAAVLELGSFLEHPPTGPDQLLLGWGLVVAAMVGWAALRVLIAFLNRGAFVWFAAYCAVLGTGYLIFA
jgi:undecaprenyl-diphosphatase